MSKLFRKLTLLAACLMMFAASPAMAQEQEQPRKQWFSEMRQLRIKYVAQELNLTEEQRQKFVPLYDAMARELMKTMSEANSLYKSVKKKGSAATDVEKEKAAEALFECKGKENAIEMRYFNQFKTILTTDQLFKLKKVEHSFNRQLMKQHRKDKKK